MMKYPHPLNADPLSEIPMGFLKSSPQPTEALRNTLGDTHSPAPDRIAVPKWNRSIAAPCYTSFKSNKYCEKGMHTGGLKVFKRIQLTEKESLYSWLHCNH